MIQCLLPCMDVSLFAGWTQQASALTLFHGILCLTRVTMFKSHRVALSCMLLWTSSSLAADVKNETSLIDPTTPILVQSDATGPQEQQQQPQHDETSGPLKVSSPSETPLSSSRNHLSPSRVQQHEPKPRQEEAQNSRNKTMNIGTTSLPATAPGLFQPETIVSHTHISPSRVQQHEPKPRQEETTSLYTRTKTMNIETSSLPAAAPRLFQQETLVSDNHISPSRVQQHEPKPRQDETTSLNTRTKTINIASSSVPAPAPGLFQTETVSSDNHIPPSRVHQHEPKPRQQETQSQHSRTKTINIETSSFPAAAPGLFQPETDSFSRTGTIHTLERKQQPLHRQRPDKNPHFRAGQTIFKQRGREPIFQTAVRRVREKQQQASSED